MPACLMDLSKPADFVQGLEVMCWPCNQFGRQEPGGSEEIRSFVDTKFGGDGITLMEKVGEQHGNGLRLGYAP